MLENWELMRLKKPSEPALEGALPFALLDFSPMTRWVYETFQQESGKRVLRVNSQMLEVSFYSAV